MAVLDYLIILAFIAYAIYQGISSRKVASQGLEEYFLAGRSLKGWHAGVSMAATQFAADTPLLVTGLIATAGVFSVWRLWIYAIAFLLMGLVLGQSWRRAGVLTDAELTEARYGDKAAAWLRGFKAIYFGTVLNCIGLAWVLFATTSIAEPFLLWDQWLPSWFFDPIVSTVESIGVPLTISEGDLVWPKTAANLISVIVIVAVTTFYSTTGGLRSVVATDLVQFAIMMVATAAFAVYIIIEVGGLGALTEGIRERFAGGGPAGMTPDELTAFTPSRAKDAGLAVLAVLGLQWLLQTNSDGTGYLAQRTMACRSDADARQAAVVFTVAQVFLRSLLWLPIGLGLLLIFPPDLGADPDTLQRVREASFVRGVSDLLPAGLKGLMVTAMLAALASTVDTHLNLVSSYWTNDLYKRFYCRWRKREASARELVWVARLSNIVVLLLAMVVMSQLGSIKEAWEKSLLLGAGVGVPLLLRWLWWRLNAWGELACMAASLILSPILLTMWADTSAYVQLLIMGAAGTGVAILVSLATRPESMSLLREFYVRARPPGFWGPVAESARRDPAAGPRFLGRSMAAVFIASLSIFSLLTALGSLLAGSPAPTWFPNRELWLIMVSAVGVILIPLWWRLGRVGEPD